MARDLTSAFVTEITASQLRAEILTIIYFDSGTTYNWTGIGNLTWNGQIFEGVGDHVSFGRMEESRAVKANGTVMSLSDVESSLVSIALQESYQGRLAEIYFVVIDISTGQIIPSPYLVFSGFMDVMEIEDVGETSTISVSVENELIDLFKSLDTYYTSEEQKKFYPNDKGLDFIPSLQDEEIIWKEKL